VSAPATKEISDWLKNLGMPEHTKPFAENKVDLSALRYLTDQDLKDIGVALGDRRKILAAISETARAIAPTPETAIRPWSSVFTAFGQVRRPSGGLTPTETPSARPSFLTFGRQTPLTAISGAMIFAEMKDVDRSAALMKEPAQLAAALKDDGTYANGRGWTDDMFMATAVLSRTTWEIERAGSEDAAQPALDCARLFVPMAHRRARRNIRALSRNQDARLKAVAEQSLQSGEIAPEAPTDV